MVVAAMANDEKCPNPDPKLGEEGMKKKRKRKRDGIKKDKASAAPAQLEEKSRVTENEDNKLEEEESDDIEMRQKKEYGDEEEKKRKKVKSGIMSSVTFESMNLSLPTMKAIQGMGFQYTTEARIRPRITAAMS